MPSTPIGILREISQAEYGSETYANLFTRLKEALRRDDYSEGEIADIIFRVNDICSRTTIGNHRFEMMMALSNALLSNLDRVRPPRPNILPQSGGLGAVPDVYLPDDTGEQMKLPESTDGNIAERRSSTHSRVILEDTDEHIALSPSAYRVWYGTNRGWKNIFSEKQGYSGRRSFTMSKSSYGYCDVHIPKSHKFGSIGSNWFKRLITLKDDRVKLQDICPLKENGFWTNLSGVQASLNPTDRQALIYIHGFNVSFEDAAIRAAQIGFDLKVAGVMAFYSWASKGAAKSYPVDEATIDASEMALTEFLCSFSEKFGQGNVHIIAHSMGNRGLLRSLKSILANAEQKSAIKFGQIFLAAPDMDAELFIQAAMAYQQLSARTTLYASPKDRAVGLSKWLHTYPRAGFTPPITTATGIDTIVVPGFDIDILGHSYYAEAEAMLHDIYDALGTNKPPARRQRLMAEGNHWILG